MDRKAFFERVRYRFGRLTQRQVDTFNAILDEWERRGGGDNRHLSYKFATAWRECRMVPIREIGRGAGKKYGPSGFYGRGLVQLTWETNYRKAGQKVGVDLVRYPDRALELPIAVKIMFDGMREGWFTGKKLSDYFNAGRNDALNARRIINGTDVAALVAKYHGWFLEAITAAGPALPPPSPIPGPKPPEPPTQRPRAPTQRPRAPTQGPRVPTQGPDAAGTPSVWARLGTALASLFRRKAR